MFCFTAMPRALVLLFGSLTGATGATLHFVPQVERAEDRAAVEKWKRERAEVAKWRADWTAGTSRLQLDAERRRWANDRSNQHPAPTIPQAEDGERIPAPATPFPTR